MFHHVKELQFNARVSGPDPRFARMLLAQFGGPNGELKAAQQEDLTNEAYTNVCFMTESAEHRR